MTRTQIRELAFPKTMEERLNSHQYGRLIYDEQSRLIDKFELGEVKCGMDGHGLGWFPVLEVFLGKMNLKPDQLVQSKQKFGLGRIYLASSASEEAQKFANLCEEAMSETCEVCGNLAPNIGPHCGWHICQECKDYDGQY
jgi:hypothetical protein